MAALVVVDQDGEEMSIAEAVRRIYQRPEDRPAPERRAVLEPDERVRELRRQRWSMWKISQELGCSVEYVRSCLHAQPGYERPASRYRSCWK